MKFMLFHLTMVKNKKTKFTDSHRKEGKCFFSSMSVISLADKPGTQGVLFPTIEASLYDTGSSNTCCLWVRGTGGQFDTHGSGHAGGYGYHRKSAAMQAAIDNAGFTLSQAIGGVGESAMREALLAIAKCIGVKKPAIVESRP